MSPFLLLLSAALAQTPPPLEQVLVDEMQRGLEVMRSQPEPAHYLALAVDDVESTEITATLGTIASARTSHDRFLDVDVRTGTPALDSTHPLRGFSSLRDDGRQRVRLPFPDGDPGDPENRFALHHAVWRELDQRYRQAAEHIVILRTNQVVKVEEETRAPDFEPRQPVVERLPPQPLVLDTQPWRDALLHISSVLDDSPVVLESSVSMRASHQQKTFVDSEGSRLQYGGDYIAFFLRVSGTAADGEKLQLSRSVSTRSVAGMPQASELEALAHEMVGLLEALQQAPRGRPYSGPVLLQGRAAAVFIHEVLGHRVEGHRQKLDDEGKTFAEYLGRPILPPFVDIVDDPTLAIYGGVELNGYYRYDDEGVPSQRVQLVDDGVFQGFLMGRSPLPRFPHSNGHGRRSTGHPPTSRMGNTILQVSQSVPYQALRTRLLREVQQQGLPYGVLVGDIEGGFTITGRYLPNAFNVRVVTSWRVYTDGRPDELIRGVDLVGTPLVAFSNLAAAGDDPQVFNGMCGAESGQVPVSAVSPSLLFHVMEMQLKEKSEDRPPLLPKPVLAADPTASAQGEPS